ncbi:MAG: 50S ribosomal protein L15 [Omnitrophica bacterium RIFCSPLOWO2_12_FULL_50_11]|nr:MAG: 50S ribosomal protein L15 [Omnitrophica bacterium RIFCSPLOWO2_12_FULL_50_11]
MKSKRPYRKRPKRVGRGPGSGHGKTATRGHKGQLARSGYSTRVGFEGGQTPLYLKVGKRGFHCPTRKSYTILNLDVLSSLKADEISPQWLLENRIVKRMRDGLKILGRGEVKRKVIVRAHRFSAHAKEAIEKAGGQAVLIGQK